MPGKGFKQINPDGSLNDINLAKRWRYNRDIQRNQNLDKPRVRSPPKNLIASRMIKIDDIKRHNTGWTPND